MSLCPSEAENHIGNTSMNTPANSNLILTALSSFERLAEVERRCSHGGLYQEIAQTLTRGVHTRHALEALAAKLTRVADRAHSIHRFDLVADIGQFLLSLPLSCQLESVGHYYRALSLSRSAGGDIARACSLFEQVAETASSRYRARAMIALGSKSMRTGDRQTAVSFYRDVTRVMARDRVFDPMTLYVVSRMTTVVKGMEGDHRGALADLEKMVPLVRMASSQQPYAYYDYLNTLAVELCEAGRLEEARRASEIALASRFASAYPEWRETREEIELKGWCSSRSTVAVAQRTPESANLITLPRASSAPTAIGLVPKSQPLARVIKFPTRTSSMPQQSERRQGLDASEKRRIVADKLYEMFMSALEDRPINLKLVEKLYIVFLDSRKQG